MSIETVVYYYVVCDDCDRDLEFDPSPDESDAEADAQDCGWEVVTPRSEHRCPACVKERREQEAMAPMLAREAVLGPWHENGNIDPAYGTALTLDVAV